MDFMWIGFFLSCFLLQTRHVFAFPRQSHIDNQEIGIQQRQSQWNGLPEMTPNIHLSKDFKDADFAGYRTEYLPEPISDIKSKLNKTIPETPLERIIRHIIKSYNIKNNISNTPTVIARPFPTLVNQKANRVKRNEDKNDISDFVNEICLTEECLEVLRQYIEWRKQNGYPARTGVTSIG